MAKKAAKKAGAKKGGGEMLVVGSKVKAAIRGNGCMTSGELLGALNEAVTSMISRACNRAKENKRSTVRPQDL
jgi:histone H3/H4